MYFVSQHTLPLRRAGVIVKAGVNLHLNCALDTLDEAISEAKFRMRQPQKPIASEVTIDFEDRTLHRWIYDPTSNAWGAEGC